MNKLWKFILVFLLLIIYICISIIINMPNNIILLKGEKLNVASIFGINLKTIEVSVLEETEVIPLGNIVGAKLYTNGVLVVGFSDIDGQRPYKNIDIQEGDRIISINDNFVNDTEELIEQIENSNGERIRIVYYRNENEMQGEIQPILNKNGEYKLGIWVRDSAAGVGTITFYNPNSEQFAALGHPITDIDTGEIINISSGEIVSVNLLNIIKGEKSEPGKIQGTMNHDISIGKIYQNTEFGIYGTIGNENLLELSEMPKMQVATRSEINLGKATILSEIEGKIDEYEIEITKIFKNNTYDNKSMIVKITDNKLLEKTGGIIQGMSGSPIIQNGKFIGAITHVFVNDPTTGYAIFGETMLKQMN